MEEEKRWIVVPTWRIEGRLERWHSIVKYYKHKTGEAKEWRYVPHHKVGWAWWTASRVIIPLLEGETLEIQAYWNLTPERGWLSRYAVRLTWYNKDFYTDVIPDVAEHLVHSAYFSCFAAFAVRQAIRGEKVTSFCSYPQAHKSQVQSLQFLALKAWQNGSQGKGPSRKQRGGNNRRGLRVARDNSHTNQQGGSKSSASRAHFPGLAKILGILA
ncbi:vif protein [Human immunodeficiency virus 2]|uniref:Virion infectivity factor n=1 Tax=Human immunodeficiency virus 2 TaxID=11709 RepID=A0A0K2GVK8_9HIV2|nr:vif protein [Human immunodeficiency virus 2]